MRRLQLRSSVGVANTLPTFSYIHPRTLTILGTYRCTAACKDCCFGSNPSITQRLDLDSIIAFIEEGSQYKSLQNVVFSGGECFLLGDDLVRAIEVSAKKGLKTRCVTNGYWAKSLPHGRLRLQQLKDAGLNELNVSTGDYHQQWVAEDAVVNAVRLGVELGFETVVLVVELQRERRVTAAQLLDNPFIFALHEGRETNHFKVIESPWMAMNIRESIGQTATHLLTSENVHLRRGCKSVLSTVVVTPAKQVGFCCGLSRELIPELNTDWQEGSLSDSLARAGSDFMKIWLFVDGPERILAWAALKNPCIDWEGRYAHHCHVCLALFDDQLVREAIVQNYRERIDDVLMRYAVFLRCQELLEGAAYA